MISAYFTKSTIKNYAFLGLLTLIAVSVHGYHYGIEDEAIYLPAIKKILNPELYPFGSEFFLSQTSLTYFPESIAFLARVTHVPLAVVVFTVHVLSIFLALTACWHLSRQCFAEPTAQW